MADAVTSQTIENGPRNFVVKFTNFSDGTGESAVVKVDPTSGFAGTTNVSLGVNVGGQIFYPGTHLKVWRIEYNVTGMTLLMQWFATSPADMWYLQGFGKHDLKYHGGLYVPQSGGAPITGANGQITFTTKGAAPGSSYTVDLWCKKDIQR